MKYLLVIIMIFFIGCSDKDNIEVDMKDYTKLGNDCVNNQILTVYQDKP